MLKPTEKDHVVIKRRDSAFQDTELRAWLQSVGINILGYDIILIADGTASGIKKYCDTTLA